MKRMYVKCKSCGAIIYRITTHTLLSHLAKHHTIGELDKDKLTDYFNITDYSTLELVEFMCPRCYKMSGGIHRTCYMDRESYETQKAIPYCAFCRQPMVLRRKKDKERYCWDQEKI